jgi:uncharacterized membrane protein HdeD (DUF308 family)
MRADRLVVALAVRGVAAVVFGVVALIWPGVTAFVLAILFGAYALVDGVSSLVAGFRRHPDLPGQGLHRAGHLVSGVLGIAAGILTIIWPGITVLVLVVLIGLWAVLTGAAEVWAGIRLRERIEAPWLLVLVGVMSVVAGLLLFFWPGPGAIAVAIVIGVYALIAGVAMLLMAWQLRKVVRADQPTLGSTGY